MRYYGLVLLFFLSSCNHYDDEEFMNYIFLESGYCVKTKEIYEEAKSEDKLVLFHFTGYGISNRQMERVIFSKRAVRQFILDNFIVVNLAVDDKSRLPENLIRKSKYKNRKINRVGEWNSEFQVDLTNNNSQPYFGIVNGKGELIAGTGYTSNKGEFVYFLKSSIKEYNIQRNKN